MRPVYESQKVARLSGWFSRRHQSRDAHDSARAKWDAEHPHRTISARMERRQRRAANRLKPSKKAA